MKKHVWIPAAGALLLTVAVMGRPSVEPPKTQVHHRSERQRPKERLVDMPSERTTEGEPEKRMEAQAVKPTESTSRPTSSELVVTPPSWVEKDSLRMRVWLLGMTNEEL